MVWGSFFPIWNFLACGSMVLRFASFFRPPPCACRLIERPGRSSCFVGPGAGGGMMGAGSFGGALDQHMGNAFGGGWEGYLDHRRKDGSDKAEPDLAGSGRVPSSEAAGGDCLSKGSDSKKRRPSEVMGGDQVQSSNVAADSADEGDRSKGKGAKDKEGSEKEDYIPCPSPARAGNQQPQHH